MQAAALARVLIPPCAGAALTPTPPQPTCAGLHQRAVRLQHRLKPSVQLLVRRPQLRVAPRGQGRGGLQALGLSLGLGLAPGLACFAWLRVRVHVPAVVHARHGVHARHLAGHQRAQRRLHQVHHRRGGGHAPEVRHHAGVDPLLRQLGAHLLGGGRGRHARTGGCRAHQSQGLPMQQGRLPTHRADALVAALHAQQLRLEVGRAQLQGGCMRLTEHAAQGWQLMASRHERGRPVLRWREQRCSCHGSAAPAHPVPPCPAPALTWSCRQRRRAGWRPARPASSCWRSAATAGR